jgi:hypothetical protein
LSTIAWIALALVSHGFAFWGGCELGTYLARAVDLLDRHTTDGPPRRRPVPLRPREILRGRPERHG